MTIKTLLGLAALAGVMAATLQGCIPFGSGAPYDQGDQYKNSGGVEQGLPADSGHRGD